MPTDSPEVARVELRGSFNGENFINVLHFARRDAAAMTQNDLQTIAGTLDDLAVDNDAWAHIFQSVDAGAVVDTIYLRTLDATTPIERFETVAISGTSVSADAPPMLAMLLRWTTEFATRNGRGRTYLPGVATGFIDGTDSDRINAGTLAVLQSRSEDFQGAWFLNATYMFCIYSRKLAAAFTPTPYSEVLGASVEPRFAIQRRRRQSLR